MFEQQHPEGESAKFIHCLKNCTTKSEKSILKVARGFHLINKFLEGRISENWLSVLIRVERRVTLI